MYRVEREARLGRARNFLTYGGNLRRNNFDISIAPAADNRLESGAYLQDEIFFDRFRLILGGRVDKFGNLDKPVFSPRVAFMVKPGADQTLTLSYNPGVPIPVDDQQLPGHEHRPARRPEPADGVSTLPYPFCSRPTCRRRPPREL